MKNQLIKDKNKRILSQNVEKQRLIIKSIYKNTSVSKLVRWNSGLKLTSISLAGDHIFQLLGQYL